jgi:outer membrane lipoprotein-sorting protein
MMNQCWVVASLFFLGFMIPPASFAQTTEANDVQAVAERMKALFQGVKDYSTEVEQIYFTDGVESQKSRFKYFFKRPNKIRVDLIHPHPGVSVFYQRGEKKATLRPFASLPSLKVPLSPDNSLLRTPTGQRIYQSDMIFFVDFLIRNLAAVPQKDCQIREGKEQIDFLLWAREYVKGEMPEKFRIYVSTQNWFPMRVERYSPEGRPMEISIMPNYVINSRLDDRFFAP